MVVKALQNVADPSRSEVGEIDTRAPFKSVKAAVSMFGESSSSPEKPTLSFRRLKSQSSESIDKVEAAPFGPKRVNKCKDYPDNCVRTGIQALNQLEKDKKRVDKLQQKLKTVNASKDAAKKVTGCKKSNEILEIEILLFSLIMINPGNGNNSKEQYVAISEVDVAKQELRRIKDLESVREAQISAIQQEVGAKHLADISSKHADQLSEDRVPIQEPIVHANLASPPAKQEESSTVSDNVPEELPYKLALEELKQKLAFSKEKYDPELAADLEVQLEKITYEISSITKELENAKASDLASIAAMANMLEDANSTLKLVMEEARILGSLVETLNLELDETKRIQLELRRKEEEAEPLVGNLEDELQKSKTKLEIASVRESKAREACDDLTSTLDRLLLESENARRDMKMKETDTEQTRKEAEAACVALDEMEQQLHVALAEAEMAKAAEAKALNQIKVLSEKTNVARNSASVSGARIRISVEEFQSLGRKVEDLETLSKSKVNAAMVQIEALTASEHEMIKKLEAILEETEAAELEEEAAINRAETAEASMRAIEHEMKMLHDAEQKSREETAARTLANMEVHVRATPLKVTVPSSSSNDKLSENKMTRENSHARKWSLIPNIFGVFYRKKTQPDVGSPSYVSGEKPGLLGVLE